MSHSATVMFTSPDEDGTFLVEVRRSDGTSAACGLGDDAVSALLDLIPALLPPKHPEHETLTDQPDDLL